MNISRTSVELSSKDLESIIEDYVAVDNLVLSKIDIDEVITLEGYYKFGINIKFSVAISFVSNTDSSIQFKLENIKVWKLKIFNFIKNKAVSKLTADLVDKGILVEKDIIDLNLKKILDKLKFYLDLNLKEIVIRKDFIDITAENIKFSMKKEAEAEVAAVLIENTEAAEQEVNLIKVEDKYTKTREFINDKMPERYAKMREYAFVLPDIIALFYRLFKDKRVSYKVKIIVGAVTAYLASPVDFIPDFIPFVGTIDDIALAFYALNKIINEVPYNVIVENWQGDIAVLTKIKNGVDKVYTVAGGENVDKLFKMIIKVYKFAKAEEEIERKHIDG